jgi:hypothetical protein
MDTMNQNRQKILQDAAEAREQEILMYQINIDNYRSAIAKIQREYPDNEDLQAMRTELITRLVEEEKQQLRSQIIYEVIQEQLTE